MKDRNKPTPTGMIVAAPASETTAIIAAAAKQGVEAQEIGSVTDEAGIKVRNRGAMQKYTNDEWLNF